MKTQISHSRISSDVASVFYCLLNTSRKIQTTKTEVSANFGCLPSLNYYEKTGGAEYRAFTSVVARKFALQKNLYEVTARPRVVSHTQRDRHLRLSLFLQLQTR